MVSGPVALVDSKSRQMIVLHAQPTLFGEDDVVGSVGHAYERHACAAPGRKSR